MYENNMARARHVAGSLHLKKKFNQQRITVIMKLCL